MGGNKVSFAGSLLVIAIATAGLSCGLRAQQSQVLQATAPAIDDDDIGGVVTSRFGPEAGVWVIARDHAISAPASPRSPSPTSAAAM